MIESESVTVLLSAVSVRTIVTGYEPVAVGMPVILKPFVSFS